MEKVLIVDDNNFFRHMLRGLLHSRLPSLNIFEAKTRQTAMEIIETSLPEVIFMDIQLPDGDGLEVTRQIKKLHPGINVVVVTSYDEPEYRDAAFRSKADQYVPKKDLMSMLIQILPVLPLVGEE